MPGSPSAVSSCGVVLAVGGIDPATRACPLTGLLLAFASSPFIYAVWVVLAARLSGERRETPSAVEASGGAGSATATVALIMTATATVYWVSGPGDRAGRSCPAQVPTAAWPGLIGVGVAADVRRHPDVLRRSPARSARRMRR